MILREALMAEQEKLGFAARFYHELDDLGLCCVGLGIIYPLKLTTSLRDAMECRIQKIRRHA